MSTRSQDDLEGKAKLYRRMAQQAADLSTKTNFLERAERYEIAAAAIGKSHAERTEKIPA